MALIDALCYQETETKVQERIEKMLRKIEKEVNEMEGSKFNKKKERVAKRIDTGLSSIRDKVVYFLFRTAN